MIPKRFIGLAVVAALVLTSCGKKAPSYTKYIPKNASTVIGIDVKSILTKLEKDSLSLEKIMASLKEIGASPDMDKGIEMFTKFKDAGIDWSQKVYVAIETNVGFTAGIGGAGGDTKFEVVAGLQDAAKFEAYLKAQPETKDIKKGEGYTYTNPDKSTAIGWSSDAVIVVYNLTSNYYYNDRGAEKTTAPGSNAASDLLKKYFAQDKDASIASVGAFADLQGKPNDINGFSQTGKAYESLPMLAALPKVKELVEGMYSTSSFNFEDGKMVMESSAIVGKKLGEILSKYAGPETDLSLLENYPSSNIDGVMAFSFKPELVPAIIKETGFDGLLGVALSQSKSGLTIEDLSKIFKGKFAVAVSDFTINKIETGKDADAYTREVPSVKMLFTAPLGDAAVINKIIALGENAGAIIKLGNRIYAAENGSPISLPVAISIANNTLTIASDSATLATYESKTQKMGLSAEVTSQLKGKAIGAYIDATQIFNGLLPSLNDSTDKLTKTILEKAKATFKNGWLTSNNFDGKSILSRAELVFGDSKKNSLGQLVRFIFSSIESLKAQEAEQRKAYQNAAVDSASAPIIEVK